MRKIICLIFVALLLASSSSVSASGKFGIGGFAGINIPIAQEDKGNGTLYGLKGRVVLLPFLGAEPNFIFSKYGDKDHEVNGVTMSRKGGDITSFGADLVLGNLSGFSRVRFYGMLGINSNTIKWEPFEDQTRMGLSVGSGVEFLPTDVFSIEVRARVHSVSLEGGGGRNNLQLTAGLNYYFGPSL